MCGVARLTVQPACLALPGLPAFCVYIHYICIQRPTSSFTADSAAASTLSPSPPFAVQYPLIGEPPSLVSVPTHFYKVVLAARRSRPQMGGSGSSEAYGAGAFVMPNAPISPDVPLSAFVVPLEALQAVAGTTFFPALLGGPAPPGGSATAGAAVGPRMRALDDAAVGWRQHGLSQMKPVDRHLLLTGPAGGGSSGVASGSGGVMPLLLPAPPSASSAASTARVSAATVSGGSPDGGLELQSAASGQPVAPRPVTVGGRGAVHLCEFAPDGCKLPAEDFWMSGGANKKSGSNGGGRRSKGGGRY